MKKTRDIPERCCANCRNLVSFPKNNAYGDIEHFCLKINSLVIGIYKNIDHSQFFKYGNIPDCKAAHDCHFIPSIGQGENS